MAICDLLGGSCSMFIAAIVGAAGLFVLARQRSSRQLLPATGKAILITGCDSGFGKESAIKLHRMGYVVFACCYDAATAVSTTFSTLKTMPTFHVLQLDVTNQQQVDTVAQFVDKWLVENKSHRLFAVFNNAGVGSFGPAEWISTGNFERVLDVNVTGVFRVSKALLPLMRRGGKDGRIVVMASFAGEVATPGGGVYCVSKAAVLSLVDILRLELSVFGIRAIGICPDFYATSIITDTQRNLATLDKELSVLGSEALTAYGGQKRIQRLIKIVTEKIPSMAKTDITPVLDCVVDAIASPEPQTRYCPNEFSSKVAKLLKVIAPGKLDKILVEKMAALGN